MEQLLHYVWQHKMFPLQPLQTTDGQSIEVIDPGLHNTNEGPDFFNAKVNIDGMLWVGNIEIHLHASDWLRHGHQKDSHYDNVILHVVGQADIPISTCSGHLPPQLVLPIPSHIAENYQELLKEANYPPCYRIIPYVDAFTAHSWMSALTVERLEEKMRRIEEYLERTQGDWERAYFITLARNFGFGNNTEAFENWAFHLPPQTIVKHRDDLFQVEAMFMGQAALLEDDGVKDDCKDDYFQKLRREYRFLAHKFSLTPMNAREWHFLRMRPQNFPHVRLAQLAQLYHQGRTGLSMMLERKQPDQLKELFSVGVTPYWETHYTFGHAGSPQKKVLQNNSLNLLLINTVVPFLFAYGRHHLNEELCERAFELLEHTKAEQNFITRSWENAGLKVEHAADSQALIQLRRKYCDKKDCIRCRFGTEYLKRIDQTTIPI